MQALPPSRFYLLIKVKNLRMNVKIIALPWSYWPCRASWKFLTAYFVSDAVYKNIKLYIEARWKGGYLLDMRIQCTSHFLLEADLHRPPLFNNTHSNRFLSALSTTVTIKLSAHLWESAIFHRSESIRHDGMHTTTKKCMHELQA